MTLKEARATLRKYGQEHLLAFYDEIDGKAKEELLGQIAGLDLDKAMKLYEDTKSGVKVEDD